MPQETRGRAVLPASVPMPREELRRHLINDHHRAVHEIGDVELGAVHRLEHVDDELGLLRLDHTHGP